ncbi:MAG: thioredoxin [Clostridia bacterium]|nr:thioredoxin [Clostridia bacterium]
MKEIILTKENFKSEVLDSTTPVIVDFWATWCGPCKMLSPVIDQIADEYYGKVKVGKVNVDDEMSLAVEYKIEVIPTLIFFKNGKIEKQTVGVLDKTEIENIIKTL